MHSIIVAYNSHCNKKTAFVGSTFVRYQSRYQYCLYLHGSRLPYISISLPGFSWFISVVVTVLDRKSDGLLASPFKSAPGLYMRLFFLVLKWSISCQIFCFFLLISFINQWYILYVFFLLFHFHLHHFSHLGRIHVVSKSGTLLSLWHSAKTWSFVFHKHCSF